MTPNTTKQDLVDNLVGELAPNAAATLATRLSDDPELAAESAALAATLQLLATEPPADTPEQLDADRIAKLLAAPAPPPAAKPWWPILLPMAAAAVVVFLGTWLNRPPQPRHVMAANESPAAPEAPTAPPTAEAAPALELLEDATLELEAAADAAGTAPDTPPQALAPDRAPNNGIRVVEPASAAPRELAEKVAAPRPLAKSAPVAPPPSASAEVQVEAAAVALPGQPRKSGAVAVSRDLAADADQVQFGAAAGDLKQADEPQLRRRLAATAVVPHRPPPPATLKALQQTVTAPTQLPQFAPFSHNGDAYVCVALSREKAEAFTRTHTPFWQQVDAAHRVHYLVTTPQLARKLGWKPPAE